MHSIQVNSDCLINLTEYAPGNNIDPRDYSGVKAVNNSSTGQVDATYNWWGAPSPDDSLFAGNVDYTLYQSSAVYGSGALKPAGAPAIPNKLILAGRYEREGNYGEALRLYNEVIVEESNKYKRKFAISSILRCNDKFGKDYSALRSILRKELVDTDLSYCAPIDFIESDLLFREGRYREAIDSYSSKLEKYRGTGMEVEMLVRIAQIYGDYLGDKGRVRDFADRAAVLNPGQDTMRFAYAASGIEYNPAAYEDRFRLDFYNGQPDPGAEPIPVERGAEEFVSLYPNPANPVTTITYSIKNPSNVQLSIYSINGQKVATLVNGPMSAGAHSVAFDGSKLASGVYFYRFESAGLTKSGKMLLLK